MSTEPDKNSPCLDLHENTQPIPDTGSFSKNNEKNKKSRTVSFPDEDQIVTQYFEPANPWQDVPSTTRAQLAAEYLEACRRHNTLPIEGVLNQIRELPENAIGGATRAPRLTLSECILLGAPPADALEAVLRKVQFRRLEVDHSAMDDEGAEALFDMIEYYESASAVCIIGPRQFGIRGWQAASRMIKKSCELSELEVGSSPLEPSHAPVLARALRPHTCRLRVLCLQRAELAGEPLLCLVIALKSNSSVRELRLGDNRLTVSDATQIASLLRLNARLQLLDLSNNLIQDAGAGHIADALVEQAAQTPPSAGASPLSPHHAPLLGAYDARGLAFLVLWNNQLTRNCAHHLSKALRSSQSLCVLNVGRNSLGTDAIRALTAGGSLISLGLQAARLGPEAAPALADLVRGYTRLQRLDLRENRLGVAGLQSLVAAMKENTTLTQIDLDDPSESSTSLTAEDSDAATVARLTREIRALCRRNEPAATSPERRVHRKISLTCHSVCMARGSPSLGSPPSVLEDERRVRLRSPLPSPAPSPAGSPVPQHHHHSRFSVTRVTPERESSTESSSPSTPTRPTYCPTPSRFRVVQVAEPPQIQVHPASQPRRSTSRFSVTRNYDSLYNPSAESGTSSNRSMQVVGTKPSANVQNINQSPITRSTESQTMELEPDTRFETNNDLVNNQIATKSAESQTVATIVPETVLVPEVNPSQTATSENQLILTILEPETKQTVHIPTISESICDNTKISSSLDGQPLTKSESTATSNIEPTATITKTSSVGKATDMQTVAKSENNHSEIPTTCEPTCGSSIAKATDKQSVAESEHNQQSVATTFEFTRSVAKATDKQPVVIPVSNVDKETTQIELKVTEHQDTEKDISQRSKLDTTQCNKVMTISQDNTSSVLTDKEKAPQTNLTNAKEEICDRELCEEKAQCKDTSQDNINVRKICESQSNVTETKDKENIHCEVSQSNTNRTQSNLAEASQDKIVHSLSQSNTDSREKITDRLICEETEVRQSNTNQGILKSDNTCEMSQSKHTNINEEDSLKANNSTSKCDVLCTEDNKLCPNPEETNQNVCDTKNGRKSISSDIVCNEINLKDKIEQIEHSEVIDNNVTKAKTKLVSNSVEISDCEKKDIKVEVTIESECDNTRKCDKKPPKRDAMKKIEAITYDLGNLIQEMKDMSTKTKKSDYDIKTINKNEYETANVILKKNKSESSLDSPDMEVSRLMNKKLIGSPFCDSNSSLEISGSSVESLNTLDHVTKPTIIQSIVESDTELDRRKADHVTLSTESSIESTSEVTPMNFLNMSVSSNESVSPVFGKKKLHGSLSSLEASVSSIDSGRHDRLMVTSADSGIEYSLQNPTEIKEDNSSNEGTLTNNSSLKETVKKDNLDTLTSPKRTSSLLDVPAKKNVERKKIPFVAPSPSFHIPRPEEKEAKLPSHLEKLLSLFQHPSSLFTRSEDDKKTSTPPRKDSSLTSSFWSWGSATEKEREEKEDSSSETTDSTLSERVQVSFVDESFSKKLDSKTPSTDTDTLSEFQSLNTTEDKVTLTTDLVQNVVLSDNISYAGTSDNTDLIKPNDLNKNLLNTAAGDSNKNSDDREVIRPRSFAAVLKSSGSENTLDKQPSPEGQPVDKLPSKIIRGIKENISPENTLMSSTSNTKALAMELSEKQIINQPIVNTVWEVAMDSKLDEFKVDNDLAPIATIEETCDEDLDKNTSIDSGVTLEIDKKDVEQVDIGKDALSYLMYENRNFNEGHSLAEELKQAEIKEMLDLSPELIIDEAVEVADVFITKEGVNSPIIPERAKIKKCNSLEQLSDEKVSPKTKTIMFKMPDITTPRDIPERRSRLRTRSGSSPKSLPESLNKPSPLTKMDVLCKKKKKVSSLGKMAKDSLLALNMSDEEIAEFRKSYKLTSVESLKSLESVSEDANSQSGNSVDSRCRSCLRTSQESLMSLDSITEDCRCTDNCEKDGQSNR